MFRFIISGKNQLNYRVPEDGTIGFIRIVKNVCPICGIKSQLPDFRYIKESHSLLEVERKKNL